MKLSILPATGVDLKALQMDGITQDMKLQNSMDG
jgi:hypothetical protein